MTAYPPIGELLAHEPPMRLLDAVTAAAEDTLTATAGIRSDNPFYIAGQGVPSYVGIEYIAQAIAALSGWRAWQEGTPIRPGLLLGSRQLAPQRSWFVPDEIISITVTSVYSDGGMAVFDGHIHAPGGQLILDARTTVYQPDDADSFATLINNQSTQS
ncbi:putative hotdog family 3-hydroxylacyl-ACP dehydratase [Methylohalomonas lacus]|uniref:Hotdog family 3-hydroxylacyl-ACP dehydratase n=1 Tax=Methylohalomonas lacus TaxID=398773 RepID=A0AAE3HHD7_9GAMM|nr:hypothetical protein [Methylohalomonas lacus]MCS3902355.1 putative hotdog family 3-hydroxylacyl-ACP dehydratase [Methylohalomonas lacus]